MSKLNRQAARETAYEKARNAACEWCAKGNRVSYQGQHEIFTLTGKQMNQIENYRLEPCAAPTPEAFMEAQDALIASQAAEIAELKRVDLLRRQTFVADANQWACESVLQAVHIATLTAQAQSMRVALDGLRTPDGCWCSTGDGNPHTQACLNAANTIAALAQVSASQVKTEEKDNE